MAEESFEDVVNLRLRHNLSRDWQLYRNMYVPGEHGISELDIVAVHYTGIYVIEVKGYSGVIYCRDSGLYWEVLTQAERYTVYNAELQNVAHISSLMHYSELPRECFESVIVFPDTSRVMVPRRRLLSVWPVRAKLTKLTKLPVYLRRQVSEKSRLFTGSDIEFINGLFGELYPVSREVKLSQLKRATEVKSKRVCPFCGARLVPIVRGGTVYMRCAAYPKCMYSVRR